jgi:hypothetical protein
VVLVFGEEVEVGGSGDIVDCIALPYSVLEFYDGVISDEGDGNINFNSHSVLQLDVQLTVFSLILLAQSFGDEIEVHRIDVPVNCELSSVFIFVVLICVADFESDIHVVVDVMGVEVEHRS